MTWAWVAFGFFVGLPALCITATALFFGAIVCVETWANARIAVSQNNAVAEQAKSKRVCQCRKEGSS